MAEWMDMARDALKAAGQCLRHGCYRSSVSRSYYAMLAAVTAALLNSGLTPPARRDTWSHPKLQELVIEALAKTLSLRHGRQIRKWLSGAYKSRIDADYKRTVTVNETTARRQLSDATAVIRRLEAEQ